MALADELAALRGARPRTFEQWLRTAAEEDKRLVYAALYDVTLAPDPLVGALRRNGIPMTRDTIAKYRESAN